MILLGRVFALIFLMASSSVSFAQDGPITLLTEDYPPFNMYADGGKRDVSGISTEIVEALFKRAGVKYSISLQPWMRSYSAALDKKDHGVFSTTRTEEREKLFQWVGPLVRNNWVLIAKKGKNIKVHKLEDAKKYRVGGYIGDATALFLEAKGFKLDLAPKDHMNAKKLANGRIDLWATGNLLGPYLAKRQGIRGLEVVHTFKRATLYLAFNLKTDRALIDRLNAELKKMNQAGILDKITKKYVQ